MPQKRYWVFHSRAGFIIYLLVSFTVLLFGLVLLASLVVHKPIPESLWAFSIRAELILSFGSLTVGLAGACAGIFGNRTKYEDTEPTT